MKYFDKVRVTNNDLYYKENNIKLNEVGIIWEPEIRDNSFFVLFDNNDDYDWYKECVIKIKDLELVEESDCTDNEILTNLPKNDPRWWCKVENGFIYNLLGEKKNKIPYDYNS